ncbi:hypothetical protein FISHEDRAFT_79061 [Fistulina hepatica ATCC 64428]|uniref:Uncharacterized protein n=1 Tax=Fistulina hepatica ATCC 64428 TaxID=1128425 RepID=A0A0D6ZZE5_9AGAR|nr:hypothetical protein FISHEDRAFT_79061 [Fistulina hepatica ATCC 64428]
MVSREMIPETGVANPPLRGGYAAGNCPQFAAPSPRWSVTSLCATCMRPYFFHGTILPTSPSSQMSSIAPASSPVIRVPPPAPTSQVLGTTSRPTATPRTASQPIVSSGTATTAVFPARRVTSETVTRSETDQRRVQAAVNHRTGPLTLTQHGSQRPRRGRRAFAHVPTAATSAPVPALSEVPPQQTANVGTSRSSKSKGKKREIPFVTLENMELPASFVAFLLPISTGLSKSHAEFLGVNQALQIFKKKGLKLGQALIEAELAITVNVTLENCFSLRQATIQAIKSHTEAMAICVSQYSSADENSWIVLRCKSWKKDTQSAILRDDYNFDTDNCWTVENIFNYRIHQDLPKLGDIDHYILIAPRAPGDYVTRNNHHCFPSRVMFGFLTNSPDEANTAMSPIHIRDYCPELQSVYVEGQFISDSAGPTFDTEYMNVDEDMDK